MPISRSRRRSRPCSSSAASWSRKSHDLRGLAQLLPGDDQARFATEDLRALDPWTLEGRYPADLADLAADRVRGLVEAAGRVVSEVHLVSRKR